MCMADLADEFYLTLEHITPRARKAHQCIECGREISPGETYEKYKGLLDGRIDTLKTCQHCVIARGWIQKQCGAWLYHGLLEDLKEHWDEEYLLRSIWLGKAIIGMRAKWHKKDGTLMEPLEPFMLRSPA